MTPSFQPPAAFATGSPSSICPICATPAAAWLFRCLLWSSMRTHGTVRTADGTEVAYQLDGEGPPLLLLAGQANNHHWWDAVRADLLAYRTLSLDWRGTGDSED